jgi:putative isomerase
MGGFVPLMAGVPTTKQAARIAQALTGPDWATPLPIPTVARGNKSYVSDGFWRGDVWPATNYQVATGLSRYGHTSLAAHIADASIDNAINVGISEHYDSQTGRALGVPYLGMSAVVLTMALDGLGAKRRMRVAR